MSRLDGALAIFLAFNLAVAQPVLDLLAQNSTFFVARHSPRSDILLLAVAITLLAPATIVLGTEILGLIHTRARRWSQAVWLMVLGTLFAMQILLKAGMKSAPGVLVLLASMIVAAAGVIVVYRARWVPRLLRIVSPIPLIVLAAFLLSGSVSKLVFAGDPAPVTGNAQVERPSNIAMIIFDELPAATLIDAKGGIDRELFPNLAGLVDGATWFRNASVVHDFTDKSVPSIMTGRYAKRGQLPTAVDHPDNLFRLLGGRYEVNAIEPLTQLCPETICKGFRGEPFKQRWKGLLSDVEVVYEHLTLPPDFRKSTPRIDQTWGHFRNPGRTRGPFAGRSFEDTDPAAEFNTFLKGIRRSSRPRFDFLHLALPHSPWRFLPDGTSYVVPKPSIFVQTQKVWVDDPWLTTMSWQRHILQTMYVDTLVGRLIAKLKQDGLYDDTMIVLTSDHGAAFEPGKQFRRIAADNLGSIAMPPLIIKLPDQRRGRIVDRAVESVDIVPTIADVLDVKGMFETDGRSALDGTQKPRTRRVIYDQSYKPMFFSVSGEERRRVVREKLSIFGEPGGVERLYRIAPDGHERLLGRPAVASGDAGIGARIAGLGDYARWDPAGDPLRTFVDGYLDAGPASRVFAIAVNGRIAAVTRGFEFNGPRFVALLPPEAFREGRNDLEVFSVQGARLLRVRLRG